MDIHGRIAAEALALVGAPFRLHGRSPETGLDCVGLVALAVARAGVRVDALPGYALRGMAAASAARGLERAGFAIVAQAGVGDVLLAESGPMQLHLMIVAEAGIVHAHAGLRRVVLMPAPSPWPLLGQWRLRTFNEQD